MPAAKFCILNFYIPLVELEPRVVFVLVLTNLRFVLYNLEQGKKKQKEVGMEKFLIGVGIAVVAMVALAFIAVIGAIPTYLLWNWLSPDLFELPRLTFWQAWGIFWLASILFKSSISTSSK